MDEVKMDEIKIDEKQNVQDIEMDDNIPRLTKEQVHFEVKDIMDKVIRISNCGKNCATYIALESVKNRAVYLQSILLYADISFEDELDLDDVLSIIVCKIETCLQLNKVGIKTRREVYVALNELRTCMYTLDIN
jgi:hypothetical protein